MESTLKDAYENCRRFNFWSDGKKAHRATLRPAPEALRLAREMLDSGRKFYDCRDYGPATRQSDNPNLIALHDDTGQGAFRLVGRVVADCGARNGVWDSRGVSGWHCDPYGESFRDGSGLCFGVVYQLTGHAGRARFVAGYQFGGIDGGPTLDLSRIWESELQAHCGDYTYCDAAKSAAHVADSMAKGAVEDKRDYQSASGAGSMYADKGEELATLRREALALLQERRAAKAQGESFPAICATVRAHVSGIVSQIAGLRKGREALASGEGYGRESWLSFWTGDSKLRAAFNESAGAQVL